MKATLKFMLLAAIVTIVAGPSRMFAQSASEAAPARKWAGTWEGKQDGVPSVVLKITGSGDALQGQAEFYVLIGHDGGPPTSAGTMTAPMIHPHVQGNDLEFQVIRKDRYGNPTDKPVLNFTMELTGDRAARLNRTGDDPLELDMVKME